MALDVRRNPALLDHLLLPDECRSLSDRSFPLQTLKPKLIGQAAKVMVKRNIRAAEARARAGAAA